MSGQLTPLGEGYRGVDGRFGYLLRQAYQAMRAAIDTAARAEGITAPQYSILSVVGHEPGLSSAEIARQTLLTPQTATETIVALERNALLERRQDPSDGRRRLVYPTTEGKRVHARVDAKVRTIENVVLDDLSPREQRRFAQALVDCAARLSEE